MPSRRDEILRATIEASRVAEEFPLGERTSFDIVGAVTRLGIPLMFRPLSTLWGVTVSLDDDEHGIMVTSNLDLHVQRFTLAHELGHVRLGHEVSFDETVGFTGRFGPKSRPVEEIAADTFASELLAPKVLMRGISTKHGWTRQALMDPNNVYQLSLRLGVSFPAACWALAAHDVVSDSTVQTLLQRTPKSIKREAVPPKLLTNPWANVWRITTGDSGTYLEAGPDDIFAVHLNDNSSAGYLWQLLDSGPSTKILEEQIEPAGESYGAEHRRVLYLQFTRPGVHQLFFSHQRPWNNHEIAKIEVAIESYGKEQPGFARCQRETALAARSE